MSRQRWRKKFKSFIDPRSDEQLAGSKIEIDGKVQKIYNLIGDDKKEALAELIGDFQKQYESLYSRYDNLTGELKNRFRRKSGKDDISSSSDSDDSSGERNGEDEIDFENSSVSEREELERKLAAALDDFSSSREENYHLKFRISEVEKALVEKESEFSDLQKRFGERNGELSEKIATLTADLRYMSDEKCEADRNVEKQRDEMSKLVIQIENVKDELSRTENLNTELEQKIADQEMEMKEQRDEFLKLNEDHKQAEVRFRDCQESIELSKTKIEEISDQFRESMAAKNQDIDELKSELESKDGEIVTLMEKMRVTEVKLALSDQKLSITGKLFNEKVNEILMGVDAFNMKFEEDYGHLTSRIYEIGNELKFVLNWLTGNNAEKDELKKEIMSLVQQLRDEKKQELVLKDKQKELEMMIEERDLKVGELEREIKEKDGGILSLSEEKRDAIRQLCIWIDFHHNRYEDLKDMFLKKRGGREQRAS